MPGIVGLVTQMPRERAESQLRLMVQAISHESFYESGIWIDDSLGVYVGWVARKGSFASGMPVTNEKRDVSLVFSGEEFPDPAALDQLRKQGHSFSADGPDYLVHVYEEDEQFPKSLNGRFHGLLIDRNRKIATLFNDRFGMHRIYYHQSSDALYFAAEAKAILAVRPEVKAINPQSAGELVSCGCVLENRTLFQGLHVLPGASIWRIRNGSVEHKSTYFNPREWEDQAELEPEAYYQQLRETVSRTFPRYFAGKEPVGMSLTGGLDTRMIIAAHKPAPGTLPCYSFGGTFRDCQDVILARKIAGACEQSYEVIPVGQPFLSKFAHYAERTVYLTDGCTDVSHSPDLFANERAASIAPARMTGNYGSEILRASRAFKPIAPTPGLFSQDFLQYTDTARMTYGGLIEGHPLSFAAFRQAPWHHYGLLSLEQTQVALRSPFLDNELVRTVYQAPRATLRSPNVSLRLIGDGDPALLRIRTDRGLGGQYNGLIAKASREFLEFTAKAEYAYDYGMPQWLARMDHAVAPLHLERLFLGRHKFYHYRVWYRDYLGAYIKEMLLDSRTLARPYLNRNTVDNMVRDHVSGRRNYTLEIHKVLTLELIHRLFLDK